MTAATFDVRGGGCGHIATTTDQAIAERIARLAIEELHERIALVWDQSGRSVFRAVARG